MRDSDLPNQPQRPDRVSRDGHDMDRIEQRLKSFQPRAPRLNLKHEILKQVGASDGNVVLRASLPTSVRSPSFGTIAGSWICGAVAGAAVMFCFLQMNPRGVDATIGVESIHRDAEAQAGLDRNERAVNSLSDNQTHSVKLPRTEVPAGSRGSSDMQNLKSGDSFGDSILGSGLFDDEVNLHAGYYLQAGEGFVSTSFRSSAGNPRGVSLTDDASRVRKEDSNIEKSYLDPPPPATRDRLLRELLDASPNGLL